MNKIMGNPTTTPMPVPDWNQKNPLKADYIKNKPDYDEIISEHEHMIGDLDTLNTDTTDNLVDAVNEIYDMSVDLSNNVVIKEEGKGLSTNDFTDDYKMSIEENNYHIGNMGNLYTENTDNLVDAINELWDGKVDQGQVVYEVDAIDDEYMQIPTVEVAKELINPPPIKAVPATLARNKQYNFGEQASLSLAFPTVANDGDVIYLTFKSGATPTALTIDTTNTCDIECIPEANTGYEIFGKFNGEIWIVNYSEYTVSEV